MRCLIPLFTFVIFHCHGQSVVFDINKIHDPFGLEFYQGIPVLVEQFKEDGLIVFHNTEIPPPGYQNMVGMTYFNADWEVEWDRSIGTPDGFSYMSIWGPNSVVRTADGGYAVAGRVKDMDDVGHICIIRLDLNADSMWSSIISPASGFFDPLHIIETDDNDLVIAGINIDSPSQGFIIRTNSTGEEIWRAIVGEPDIGDNLKTVTATPDGGFIASGIRHINYSTWDLWLVKVDGSGTVLWENTFSGYGFRNFPSSIIALSNGGYAIASATGVTISAYEHWVLKIDEAGNEIWNTKMGPAHQLNSTWDIIELPDGRLLTCGMGRGEIEINNWMGHIGCYSADGDSLWQQLICYSDADEPITRGMLRSILLNDAGQVIIAGRSDPPWISTNSALERDIWLVSFNPDGPSTGSMDDRTNGPDRPLIYPNPATGEFNIVPSRLNGDRNMEVRLYNCDGREVLHKRYTGRGDKITITLQSVSPGMYIVAISLDQSWTYQQLIIN